MSRVLVTGANGFVGKALVHHLIQDDRFTPMAAMRAPDARLLKNSEIVVIPDLSINSNWSKALVGVSAVVHLAARVHVMHDTAIDPLAEFRKVNVEGALGLARQAAAAGVHRFIFLSSVKVNGEVTQPDQPFTASDSPFPQDAYGQSKWEAEQSLHEIASQTGMEIVIIRPPLVYGPAVKANFATMMHWIARGVPLPLGAVTRNRRSLVALDNLVDLIVTCLHHPAAANQTFLVSDGEDLSTADLLMRMGQALGKPARLAPIPPGVLELCARLIGKTNLAQRLLGNLQVDIQHTRDVLGWHPPISVDEGLHRSALDYLS